MKQVNMYEAKTHLSSLVDAALAGGEVVIARHGKPCVKLVPVEAPKRSLVMPWAGQPLVDVYGNVRQPGDPMPSFEWTDEEIAEMVDAPVLSQGDEGQPWFVKADSVP